MTTPSPSRAAFRRRSGSVNSTDLLEVFVYELMHRIPAGDLEELAAKCDGHLDGKPARFTNGWQAQHAKDFVKRFDAARRLRRGR